MADAVLEVDPRVVSGKKVKALRREGIIPAHLYGRGTESLAVQAPVQTITNLLKTAGRNAIIDLQINGESEARPVVLRGVQRNPVTSELLHIDFLQISMTEKLRAEVPLLLTGEAPAVTVYNGVLLQNLDALTVEGLPTDIPENIEVDVSHLEEIDASIFVRDLSVPASVRVQTDLDQVVAKVAAPKLAAEMEREEAEAAAAAAAAAAEAEEAEERVEGAPAEEEKEDGAEGKTE